MAGTLETLNELPRKIDRQRVVDACETLGINPRGVRSVQIERDYVEVVLRIVIDDWRTDDPVPGEDDE